MDRIVKRAKHLQGGIAVPGDKSISHRALILGAIAEGDTAIENLSKGGDVKSTMSCLRALGIRIETDGANVLVHGEGLGGLKAPKRLLDAANSGTTMRLLAGVLAGQPFTSTITGDGSLRRRPMRRILEPLTLMGAKISSQGGFAPLRIQGTKLKAIRYPMPIASAQVKSCLLLAGLYASGTTTVLEPVPTRDHTERLMAHFGVRLKRGPLTVSVEGGSKPRARAVSIPGDLSSGAFLLAAATLLKDSQLVLTDVGINETRTGFLSALTAMGAQISISSKREVNHEPRADIRITYAELKALEVSGGPALIDELPILAVVATQAVGTSIIKDAQELRVKETDRIRATVMNLKKMGALIEERPDGMRIKGPCPLHGARVKSYGDHRIAMALAVAGLIAEGETIIEGAQCVDISFPGFFEHLEQLTTYED